MSYKASINITTDNPTLFQNIGNVSISNAFRNIGTHFQAVGNGAISESVIVNYGLVYGSDVFTITASNLADSDTVTINGTVLTAKTSPSGAAQFAVGNGAIASAVNLANCINAHPTLSQTFKAKAGSSSTSGTVTLSVLAANSTSYSVSKSATNGSWAAATLSGTAGAVSATNVFTITASNLSAADTVKIGTVTFTAEASGAVGNQFNVGGSARVTADNLAAAINAYSGTKTVFSAVSSGTTTGIVTVTVLMPGVVGNQIPVTKSATNGSWSNTTFFTGGIDANVLTLHHGL